MKKIKILDCTLRDGGYYNDWDFDYDKSKSVIKALNDAGLDIIEVGYKSIERDKFYGLFKYCSEGALSYLKEYSAAEYAFMIDLKEFTKDGAINLVGLDSVILPASESVFHWVRIASHYATVKLAPEFITYFRNKGYKVGFNLMGGSLLNDDEIVTALNIIKGDKPDYFYIADSFGSFYPAEVKRLITLIKNNYEGPIGIHTHDNQGLAYANTLTAIECGVDIVDCTITGMGRGAGNLLTEQFLLGYAEKNGDSKIKPSALLDVLHSYMLPLKKEYEWGFNYTYMLSGLKNIHPTYGQNVNDNKKFTMSEISGILESIPAASKAKYSDKLLLETMNKYLHTEKTEGNFKLPLFDAHNYPNEAVLIVSNGASLKKYLHFVTDFAHENSMQIIECNDTGLLDGEKDRIVTILNNVRIQEFVGKITEKHFKAFISGQPVLSSLSSEKIYHQPYMVGGLSISENEIGIPAYEAGIYSVMLSLKLGAKKIYLAGFEGYSGEDTDKNSIMENFFTQLSNTGITKGVEIVSLTPTHYKALKEVSVFALM